MVKELELINRLNEANEKYYNSGSPIMTDTEYDLLYEELKKLEATRGVVYANSPTCHVGASILPSLEKVLIPGKPMLSLEKVHTTQEIAEFGFDECLVAMTKCDGLSIRLIYENGKFISANTRGNGEVGANITEHIKQFTNVPLTIPYTGRYVIDGEAVIKLTDFEEINKDNKFANPRNTASGALNSLDTSVIAERRLSFIAWDIIEGSNKTFLIGKFAEASGYGFEIVPYHSVVNCDKLDEINQDLMSEKYNIPADGVVYKIDDTSASYGRTAKSFKNAIAWKPEVAKATTYLRNVEWSMGRTGALTPIAIFDPITIEGATIERASLHNISIYKSLLGEAHQGQELTIFRANLIIPQVLSAVSTNEGEIIPIPQVCPICGGAVQEVTNVDSTELVCINPACDGKLVNRLAHFASKKGLDIKGFSKITIEKLIDMGWLKEYADFFKLKDHLRQWINLAGFGEASVAKLCKAVESAKIVSLENFISSIGIPLIGQNVAKELVKYIKSFPELVQKCENHFDFTQYDGFAEAKCYALWHYDFTEANRVYEYLSIITNESVEPSSSSLEGKSICITGSLKNFKNRTEFTAAVENAGGKVVSAVSRKTDYLVNNDKHSSSSKNLTAKRYEIPILSEEEFIEKFLTI